MNNSHDMIDLIEQWAKIVHIASTEPSMCTITLVDISTDTFFSFCGHLTIKESSTLHSLFKKFRPNAAIDVRFHIS